MDTFNPTSKTEASLTTALQSAFAAGNPEIAPAHLLISMLDQADGAVAALLQAVGADPSVVRRGAQDLADQLPTTADAGAVPQLGRDVLAVCSAARRAATESGATHVSTEHVMLGLVAGDTAEAGLLAAHGVTAETLHAVLPAEPGGATVDADPANSRWALRKYTTDLTESARGGELDPVVGRSAEIRRLALISSLRSRNAAVLVGADGVGKTSIIAGLAQRITAGEAPDLWRDNVVVRLDLAAMAAGASGFGEFEQRLTAVLDGIEDRAARALVVIDELSTLATVADALATSATIVLAPVLARRALRLVGTATPETYARLVAGDSALTRVFQQVEVREPDHADAVAMLRGVRPRYEAHHRVRITDHAVQAAVLLADRHLPGPLPDKAIHLIDAAAAQLRMATLDRPVDVDELQDAVHRLETEQAALQREPAEQVAERSSRLRSELTSARARLSQLLTEWRDRQRAADQIMDLQDDLNQRTAGWLEEQRVVDRDLAQQLADARAEYERAERTGDFGLASKLRYSTIPHLEQRVVERAESAQAPLAVSVGQVEDWHIAALVSEWAGVPLDRLNLS
ncbi:Clp protease N-terminal domain-containing protein [Nocardia brasiliensis]|uniref:Clp protease N-terminal domain-containing protein n=1 Tax=Nocardia brasiliensis TaxID=37326 RepID=UPI002454A058|nr:Clp protease N-terminal domain-containing protein [Nocardia brasiliensis]